MNNRKKQGIIYFASDIKRVERAFAFALADILSVVIAAIGALWVRFDFSFSSIGKAYLNSAESMLWFDILSTIIIYFLFKLYVSVWRYASSNELIKVALAVICEGLLQLVTFKLAHIDVPRSYFVFYTAILGALTLCSRFFYRFLRIVRTHHRAMNNNENNKSIMIIGAGAAGNAILKEMEQSAFIAGKVKCFIDDNSGCHGKIMRGVPIVGGRDKIQDAVELFDITDIIIAIPTLPKKEIKKLVEICKETGCKLQIVPGIYQLINGDVTVSQLREVDIEDLLGREPAEIDVDGIIGYIKDRVVLVTGGGGSIGSELCRQLAAHGPKQLIIVDIYENNAYDIQQELKRKYPKLNLVVLIASVRNTKRIEQIFEEYRPDIVYHAAAHKHVPLMEDSPGEAIKNNVFGTYKTAVAASKFGTKRFVLVSTDKAVNPTNIMGASKRMCEMVIQMMNEQSDTEFVAVRFGNVLGSNGSVIPLFKKQIAAGGPVTVTDPNIIRYFMTIPEAVSLILQAGAYAKGGEIFVLDMGEPVRILDLAENLIKLSGYKVGEDIDIVFTGLRPGEKMYEEMLMKEEGLKKTDNSMIFIGKPIEFDVIEFKEKLKELDVVSKEEPRKVKNLVGSIVKTYRWDDNK